VSGTRPTAKMNPSIHKDNIPINKLERFNQEMLPAQRWEQHISESIAESIRKK
jgi:hypothetical protein